MITYSKGRWYIADEDELAEVSTGDQPFGIWVEDENGEHVRVASIDCSDVTPDFIRGNAHLLTNAPDMLKAITTFVATLPVTIGPELCVTMEMLHAIAMLRVVAQNVNSGGKR